MNNTNKIIYGKNDLERIVSIEVENEQLTIFREDADSITAPNKFWILANRPLNNKFIKLDGNLFYKYGIQFTKLDEFRKYRHIWRNESIFSIYDSVESAMVKDGYTMFKGMKPQDVSALSFDIETTGLKHNNESKVLLISNTFRKNGIIQRKLFCYDDYENDGEMFTDWVNWVNLCNPSILLGHNIYTFDLPYMQFVANRNNVSLNIGRDASPIKFDKNASKFRKDSSQDLSYHRAKVYGRQLIDTMFLSIKYDVGRAFPNYRLKDIVTHLGLEAKDRQFYDASQIRFKYEDLIEWEKIKTYCVHDSDDALNIYDFMIPAFFYLTQTVPKQFQSIIQGASGSQINSMMIRSYLQDGHSISKADDAEHFEGAISIGVPGVYKHCLKADISSLYPSIMLEYNIYSKIKDPKRHMLQILEVFTNERLKNKKLAKETQEKYYDDLQGAQKIIINSIFGFMGAPGLNFNYIKGASDVTQHGRSILSTAFKWATSKTYEEWSIQNNA